MTTAHDERPALLTLDVDGGTFRLRHATQADLPQILELLADDQLGANREDSSDMGPYERAFEAIDGDPAHLRVVGDGSVASGSGRLWSPGPRRSPAAEAAL